MQISKIRIGSRYFDEIINIYYNWWGKDIKKMSKDNICNIYKTNDTLPVIYGLIINDNLIGLYELNKKDDIDDYEYSPYLANVYIKERYRGNGYSKILIEDAILRTKKMGYKKLYLHTHHENFYEKIGFNYLCEVNSNYGKKRVFEKNL